MKKISLFIVYLILFSCSPNEGSFQDDKNNSEEGNKASFNEAVIINDKGSNTINFAIEQPSKHSHEEQLYISVEYPKGKSPKTMEGYVNILGDEEKSFPLKSVKNESLRITFPPGPDNATNWKVFSVDLQSNKDLASNNLGVSIKMSDGQDLHFTRIIIGKPATINSTLIGAFNPNVETDGEIIKAGTDLLGTQMARQYMQFPADIFGKGSKAFAGVVDFVEVRLSKETSNADTEMVRTKDVGVGGTSPIKLVNFENTTIKPIKVETKEGPIHVTVTANLSSNARSHGFITINKDGTYESTTMLFPVLTLQQVDEKGESINEPVVIDTALTQIAGYPFYLASNGGKWTDTPPANVLVTENSSNFFYNNGSVNNFIHSNGGGPGVLGACAKNTVQVNL